MEIGPLQRIKILLSTIENLILIIFEMLVNGSCVIGMPLAALYAAT